MRAMILAEQRAPLTLRELADPIPGPGMVRVRVSSCAVCRTDLHVVDGELPDPKLPLVPGHEVVGIVEALGEGVDGMTLGSRVGVPWLGFTCGRCDFCLRGQENLCEHARFTGYTLDGGYAEAVLVDHRFAIPIPDGYSDAHAAPLLCAGLIGFRALSMTEQGHHLGIYGFGAAAHIVAQVARHQGCEIYAFTRPGDREAQAFARELGVTWAGDSGTKPPVPLDAAIIFAPVGALIPEALGATRRGGVVVCGGIHMSDVPSFPYSLLWGERSLRSVANLTRRDAAEFFEIAAKTPISTEVTLFPLPEANEALRALREGRLRGAAVLDVGGT